MNPTRQAASVTYPNESAFSGPHGSSGATNTPDSPAYIQLVGAGASHVPGEGRKHATSCHERGPRTAAAAR